MADGLEHDVIGFTRRDADAMMNCSSHTPEHVAPNVLRIRLPSLSHTVFDTQGQRQFVCYIMKLLDMTSLYWPFPTKDMDEKLIFYILNYDMTIHPSLYDDTKKRPLNIDARINYVKRSSRCYQMDITPSEQMAPLATVRYLEVFIDPQTKKPKPFPQWWKDEHEFPTDGPKPEIKDVPKPLSGVLTTERRIYFTDTDENNHTNFVVYVRLCLDTFYENVHHRKYMNSSPLFLNGWVKDLKITFKSDTVLGDILTIESWEDGESPNTFHFEIRKGQEVATVVTLSFFSSLTDSHL